MTKQEYIATLTARQIYAATYQAYRVFSTTRDVTGRWYVKDSITELERSAPKIAEAARTSFETRDLYHS